MRIFISNSSADPIYMQIVHQIKNQIIKGELQSGDSLPSIRNLAKELEISVITTKRAYEELEKDGFIQTVGGKGSYVAPQSDEILREKRLKIVEEKMVELVKESRVLNIGIDELKEMLQLIYTEVN